MCDLLWAGIDRSLAKRGGGAQGSVGCLSPSCKHGSWTDGPNSSPVGLHFQLLPVATPGCPSAMSRPPLLSGTEDFQAKMLEPGPWTHTCVLQGEDAALGPHSSSVLTNRDDQSATSQGRLGGQSAPTVPGDTAFLHSSNKGQCRVSHVTARCVPGCGSKQDRPRVARAGCGETEDRQDTGRGGSGAQATSQEGSDGARAGLGAAGQEGAGASWGQREEGPEAGVSAAGS